MDQQVAAVVGERRLDDLLGSVAIAEELLLGAAIDGAPEHAVAPLGVPRVVDSAMVGRDGDAEVAPQRQRRPRVTARVDVVEARLGLVGAAVADVVRDPLPIVGHVVNPDARRMLRVHRQRVDEEDPDR